VLIGCFSDSWPTQSTVAPWSKGSQLRIYHSRVQSAKLSDVILKDTPWIRGHWRTKRYVLRLGLEGPGLGLKVLWIGCGYCETITGWLGFREHFRNRRYMMYRVAANSLLHRIIYKDVSQGCGLSPWKMTSTLFIAIWCRATDPRINASLRSRHSTIHTPFSSCIFKNGKTTHKQCENYWILQGMINYTPLKTILWLPAILPSIWCLNIEGYVSQHSHLSNIEYSTVIFR